MIMCSICKKNIAVIFVTRIIDGKSLQEGMCLPCAKSKGINSMGQLFEQSGMTEDEIEQLSSQVNDFLKNVDLNELSHSIEPKGMLEDLEQDDEQTNDEEKVSDNRSNLKAKIATDKKMSKKRKYLDSYGTNITVLAKEGKVDRIIGRNEEIAHAIQILNRRNKNNPVLIGEPGVGKTAIIEGLALRIANKQVPAKLLDAEIYSLDLAAIVAGTQFRGQFESRMKGIIDEAKGIGNIILAIDELHNIMGAGEADGAMNAANILKPALSKREIQIIGATTLEEYRKHIEKDSALERRFQPIVVSEPSVEETVRVLQGIKEYYEKYHTVKIPEELLKSIALLSERYITDRFLPDKAIDVLDDACSTVNLSNPTITKLELLKAELKKIQSEKENAISADSIEDYQKAADLKVHECRLLKEISEIEEQSKSVEITIEDVASVIFNWTKVPIKRITETEAEKLLSLEERLHKRVIGQDKAVKSLAQAIRRSRADFKKIKKPSSFIFVGPTGVGKTELVKALAVELFDSEEALIRLDMSEFMEKHSSAKLIGAPPGYVGFDDRVQFTEKVRQKPYSVILFDEIEKAHHDVFNILLQILDDGRLTDNHGRVINFTNTVIIMTSNAGTDLSANGIGFINDAHGALEIKVNNVLKQIFRPEFLNRVDDVVVFHSLSKIELKSIVDIMLKEVSDEALAKGIVLEVTPSAKEFLIEKGYSPKYGARPLRRAIQTFIEDELAEGFLKKTYRAGSTVCVDSINGEIVFSLAP